MNVERDWLQVVRHETCADCGFATSAVPRSGLGAALRREGSDWTEVLGHRPTSELRRRRRPEVWSPLEYGAHVRDVLDVFSACVELALVQDRPEFGWWDHEAAAVDDAYRDQDPDTVAMALSGNAARMATVLESLDPDAWERSGTRRGSETFTVFSLGEFALHEARHHRRDAVEQLLDTVLDTARGPVP